MKAIVRFYPEGMARKKAQELFGADIPPNKEDFAVVTFEGQGVGLYLERDEALELGITQEELYKAAEKPQEYQVTLTPVTSIKKEALCGANN